MTRRYGVYFRTHFWDDYVARMAARLQAVSSEPVVVVADETANAIAVDGYRKISCTADEFASWGLCVEPRDEALWYNGDYAYYKILREDTDVRYYVVVEYDAVMRKAADEVIDLVAASGIDFVAHDVRLAEPNWDWTDHHRSLYDPVVACLFPITVISSVAAAFLFARRLELSRAFRSGEVMNWPFCEAFVPSELARTRRFPGAKLADIGNADHVRFLQPFLETDIDETAEGDFLHPVLSGERYARSRIRLADGAILRTYFEPGSDLRRDLDRLDTAVVRTVLGEAFAAQADERSLARLADELGPDA